MPLLVAVVDSAQAAAVFERCRVCMKSHDQRAPVRAFVAAERIERGRGNEIHAVLQSMNQRIAAGLRQQKIVAQPERGQVGTGVGQRKRVAARRQPRRNGGVKIVEQPAPVGGEPARDIVHRQGGDPVHGRSAQQRKSVSLTRQAIVVADRRQNVGKGRLAAIRRIDEEWTGDTAHANA